MDDKKLTIADVIEKARRGERLTMLTAVDYPTGQLIDRAGIDMALVGDSLGMTALGLESTVPVTMDEMIHHVKAVVRAVKHAVVVGDLPFGSYHVGVEDARCNAVRMIKEGGAECVKLEGGSLMAPTIQAMVEMGIPVCGHIGLTPQTASALGGFKVQGRSLETARKLLDDAKAIERAGVFAMVVEAVPGELAALITETVSVPTIGIGAGIGCKGQVMVTHDMVGLFDRFTPKFAKKYADVSGIILEAMRTWRNEVSGDTFPGPEHTFAIKEEIIRQLRAGQ